MDKVEVKGVEILRTGQFSAIKGGEVNVDRARIDRIVASYDPKFHTARITPDHANTGPAFGAVTGVRRDGDRMLADFDGVPKDVADEMGEHGAWASRSAELYKDLDGKGEYLKAVSILGAQAPAVKGMAPVVLAFSESEDTQTFRCTLSEEVLMPDPSNIEKLAEQVGTLNAQKAKDDEAIAKLSEVNTEAVTKLTASEAALKLAEESLTKLRAKDKENQGKQRVTDAKEFVTKLREDRRCTPGMEDAGLVTLLAEMAGSTDEVIALAEGKTATMADTLKAVLSALPQFVPLDELAPGATDPGSAVSLSAAQKATAIEMAADTGQTVELCEAEMLSAAKYELQRAAKGGGK